MKSALFTTAVAGFIFVAQSPGQTTPAKDQRLREDVQEHLQANQPLDFYGQVVDQTGAVVKGIKAIATVYAWVDTGTKSTDYEQREEDYLLTSDSQGRIELRNKKGTQLEIRLQPTPGFLYSPSLPWQFNYDPSMDHPGGLPLHHPSSQNPVVFRVWNALGGEPVVKWGKGERLNQDGTLIGVDLLGARLCASDRPNANFRFAVKADFPADMGPRRIDRYRWTVHVEALNGGVVISNDDYMYLAPEGGYTPVADLVFDPNSPNWDFQKTIKFYYRTADGKHRSRVVLELRTRSGEPTGVFTVSAVTNLTGSRNLEEGRLLQSADAPTR